MFSRQLAILTFVVLAGACAVLPAHADAVYTWVDADGVRHFSQQPPAEGDYEAMNVQVPAPATPPPAAATTDQPTAQERVDEYLSERDEAQRQRNLAQAEKAARQQNCETARQNLATVESRTRVMVPEADGSMRQLSDEERLAALEQAHADVAKFCD